MPQTFYLEISVTPDVDGLVYDCTRVAKAFENGTANEALCAALAGTVELLEVTTDEVNAYEFTVAKYSITVGGWVPFEHGYATPEEARAAARIYAERYSGTKFGVFDEGDSGPVTYSHVVSGSTGKA